MLILLRAAAASRHEGLLPAGKIRGRCSQSCNKTWHVSMRAIWQVTRQSTFLSPHRPPQNTWLVCVHTAGNKQLACYICRTGNPIFPVPPCSTNDATGYSIAAAADTWKKAHVLCEWRSLHASIEVLECTRPNKRGAKSLQRRIPEESWSKRSQGHVLCEHDIQKTLLQNSRNKLHKNDGISAQACPSAHICKANRSPRTFTGCPTSRFCACVMFKKQKSR